MSGAEPLSCSLYLFGPLPRGCLTRLRLEIVGLTLTYRDTGRMEGHFSDLRTVPVRHHGDHLPRDRRLPSTARDRAPGSEVAMAATSDEVAERMTTRLRPAKVQRIRNARQ